MDILDAALGKNVVAVADLIELEVLQGFRSDKDYKTATAFWQNLLHSLQPALRRPSFEADFLKPHRISSEAYLRLFCKYAKLGE